MISVSAYSETLNIKNAEFNGGQENVYDDGKDKSVLGGHRLSSFGKPRDANQWSLGWIFLSHPQIHDTFL